MEMGIGTDMGMNPIGGKKKKRIDEEGTGSVR
jgi:hypothetical protein